MRIAWAISVIVLLASFHHSNVCGANLFDKPRRDGMEGYPETSPWPCEHGDNHNAGRSVIAGPSESVVPRWTFISRQPAFSPAMYAPDNRVYYQTREGIMYKGSAENFVMSLFWTFFSAGDDASLPILGAPAIAADSTGIATSATGEVHFSDGADDIYSTACAPVTGGVKIGKDGSFYLADNGDNNCGWMYKYDAERNYLWSKYYYGGIPGSLALSDDGSKLWALSGDGWLYEIDASDGNLMLMSDGTEKKRIVCDPSYTGGAIAGVVVSDNETVAYIACKWFNIYAVSLMPEDEYVFEVIWEYEYYPDLSVYSTPALSWDNSMLIYGSWDANVWALSTEDGTAMWTFTTKSRISSSPLIGSNDVVYISSDDGYLYALSVSDGSELWHFFVGGLASINPTIGANGDILIASYSQPSLFSLQASVCDMFHIKNPGTWCICPEGLYSDEASSSSCTMCPVRTWGEAAHRMGACYGLYCSSLCTSLM
jgi:outer membrane protein assembly factor BamB